MNESIDISESPDAARSRVEILLIEYQAIEQMHAHYDVLNMSMTAFVSAGIFTLWGLILQSAFGSKDLLIDSFYICTISVFAVVIFLVLSIWIRYLTIHRTIVIQKLNRSHAIEVELKMEQNSIFKYNYSKLKEDIASNIQTKRRPGGHSLELLLYFSLSTFGGLLALILQWHIRDQWEGINLFLVIILVTSPFISILWMTFCKLDAAEYIPGCNLGMPWNLFSKVAIPINRFARWFFNLGSISIRDIGS